jgi:hypothetical protein
MVMARVKKLSIAAGWALLVLTGGPDADLNLLRSKRRPAKLDVN